MPDPNLQDSAVDRSLRRADWHAAAPVLQVRWLAGIAVLVPLLLAAGVYWLHRVPIGTASSATPDAVVEIRLITAQENVAQQREATPRPVQAASASQSEPLVEDPNRSIPKETTPSASAEASRVPPSTTMSAPVSSAAPVRIPMSQIAAAFQQTLLRHIARFRHYPDEARRERVQGTVQLMFAMRRDGTVTDVWVKASSGHEILDAAAVETIRQAQPLPTIPSDLPDSLNILVPVAFDLP